ncbi:MAG TPA: hypothetical protein ENH30_01510 [Nitrospirae bacterium]|nr:hypothetical protein [Nitrospirota bacterium]
MKMTREMWEQVKYFHPYRENSPDNFGDPLAIEQELVFNLDLFRIRICRPVLIHCGTDKEHSGTGQHPLGRAVDCHVAGVDLLDMFLAAERIGFKGIGVYQWGLHLDVRVGGIARWCKLSKTYLPLEAKYMDVLRRIYQYKGG